MEKITQYLLTLSILILLCSGCQKEPIAPEIEGHWRLTSITTDGATQSCSDLFYSISLQVVEVSCKPAKPGYGTYIGLIEYPTENTLRMKDFRERSGTFDNGIPASIEALLPYGIHATDTEFIIVKKGGNSLILQSDYATLHLEKF